MKNNSHLTAIKRNRLSAPVTELLDSGKIAGHVLDYGCGRGDDVRILYNSGIDIKGYDPHWKNDNAVLKDKYDTILCTYVLNVVGAEKRKEIIRKVKKLCKDDADIYISVRRDVKKEETSSRGTKQYPVKLDLDIVEENTHYCIYHIKVQRCRRCNSIKSIENFKEIPDGGVTKACKKCLKKISKFSKNYDLTLKRRYWYYKKDARRDKRKFDLSMSDFDNITSQPCYYCGAWSISNPGKCGMDRVDSDGGYEINNCVACCGTCNFMKRNLTEKDFIEHIKRIYEYSVVKK